MLDKYESELNTGDAILLVDEEDGNLRHAVIVDLAPLPNEPDYALVQIVGEVNPHGFIYTVYRDMTHDIVKSDSPHGTMLLLREEHQC